MPLSMNSMRLQKLLQFGCWVSVLCSLANAWSPSSSWARRNSETRRLQQQPAPSTLPLFGHERIRTLRSSFLYPAAISTSALRASSSPRSSSQSTATTTSSQGDSNQMMMDSLCEQVQQLTAQGHYTKAFTVLTHLMDALDNEFSSDAASQNDPLRHQQLSRLADRTCRFFTQSIFTSSSSSSQQQRHSWSTLLLGLQAMELQWHSSAMAAPYHTLPRATVQQALQAITRYNERQYPTTTATIRSHKRNHLNTLHNKTPSQLAFRLLQRLLSGVGVRSAASAKTQQSTSSTIPPTTTTTTQQHHRVYEKDINMVLNTFSNAGHMHICHRIVALQQRSPQTPPLSAAAYSILFKGHGLRKDYQSLQMVLQHALEHLPTTQMDTIWCNSLVNAFIQCGAVGDAFAVFDAMRNKETEQEEVFRLATAEQADNCPLTELSASLPRPNQRTYNIVLKGLAQTQNVDAALELFEEMKRRHKWDPISINSLVQVALSTENFDLAHELLENYTSAISEDAPGNQRRRRKRQRHPNTEAYTQLLDSYAKAGRLSDALLVFGLMRLRQIRPNEFTYTCLIAGLARNGKVEDAHKMLEVMKTTSTTPTIVTYNALISALTSTPLSESSSTLSNSTTMNQSSSEASDSTNAQHASSETASISYQAVEEALKVLRSMIRNKVKPNAITVCTLVDALGRCSPLPRVQEAILLVDRLEAQQLIPPAEPRIISALIHTAGMGQNMTAAVRAFRRFSDHNRPVDVVAVNSFLDACCKCGRGNAAMDTFNHYFVNDKASSSSVTINGREKASNRSALEPDVITYSTLITHLLKSGKYAATEKARKLYASMKHTHRICPDTGLVDSILKSMLQTARLSRLPKEDVLFVATVLRDAQRLEWSEGQLERRQRAVRAVLADRFQELRGSSEVSSLLRDILLQPNQDDDDLFRRKGWNTIDSSMRILWGGQGNSFEQGGESKDGDKVDAFLKSKGWNNVDSGFRII